MDINYQEIEANYTSGFYAKRNACFVRGAGATLWDDQGRDYIDCGAGIAVANLGHAHPRLVAAIAEQAATLITAPELAYNDKRALYLQRLTATLPAGLNRAFLCNSGTEAIEGAIKIARLVTNRPNIVATKNGFHGRTLGALSATHKEAYRQPFQPLVPGFSHISYGKLAEAEEAITDQVAAVIVELIQGEGGVKVADPAFIAGLRRLCDERGALLIVDEIQTGFGRTGTLFACEQFQLAPDLLCLGKAIAGGVPMGAIGIHDKLGPLPSGTHGSTFGGNPLACAAALATLDIIADEQLLARSRELGDYFQERLQEINSPLIRQVRGRGLMIGVEMKVKVAPYLKLLLDRGVLVLNAGTTVFRFLPPLVITREQIDTVVAILSDVLSRPIGAEA